MWLSDKNYQYYSFKALFLKIFNGCSGLCLFGLVLTSCADVSVYRLGIDSQANVKPINIIMVAGRDGQLFTREMRKLAGFNGATDAVYDFQSSISYNALNSLSVQGDSSTLKKASMTASFTLTDRSTKKVVLSDSIIADATIRTITSLYGQDRSEIHARDRLAILLAQRSFRRVQLYLISLEN